MVGAPEVRDGPTQGRHGKASDPRPDDAEWEQGLDLRAGRSQHDGPGGLHGTCFRALRPGAVPGPAHEGAADTRPGEQVVPHARTDIQRLDRKSTRLNSSHDQISYAVFCLKKKKKHSYNSLVNLTR